MRRLLLRVRVASLTLRLDDAARLKKVGTGPEVLGSTMPWGLNPPRGHPILSLRLDGAILAMVVREASGRRGSGGGGGSSSSSSRGKAKVGGGRGAGHRGGLGSAEAGFGAAVGAARGANRETSRSCSTTSSSSRGCYDGGQGAPSYASSSRKRGGQGMMTEGAVTLTVASVRAEGSDAGVDKSRGVMLPILAVSPKLSSVRRGSSNDYNNIRRGDADAGGGAGAGADNDNSFAADIRQASSSVADGPAGAPRGGDAVDGFPAAPSFTSQPPPPRPSSASASASRPPSSGSGLEIAVKWTLEPLHGGGSGGGGVSAAPGARRRRSGNGAGNGGTSNYRPRFFALFFCF